MDINIKTLKKIIADLDDDVILASLNENDGITKFTNVKRLLVLRNDKTGVKYLTINKMGSHFTGEGKQKNLKFAGIYFDVFNLME